jgi:hypothetical protein
MLNEALNQAVKLEVTNSVSEPPSRLQVVTAEVLVRTHLLGAERRSIGQPVCWQCEDIEHYKMDCSWEHPEEGCLTGQPEPEKWVGDGMNSYITLALSCHIWRVKEEE